jgi:hypothetical protein
MISPGQRTHRAEPSPLAMLVVGVAAAAAWCAILLGYCAWWMAARAAKRKFRGRWWWNFFRRRAPMHTLPMNIFRFIHTVAAGARAATQHDEPDAKREIAKIPRLMCPCAVALSPSSTINKLFFVLAWFMQRIDIILIIMWLPVCEPTARIKRAAKDINHIPQGSSNIYGQYNKTGPYYLLQCNILTTMRHFAQTPAVKAVTGLGLEIEQVVNCKCQF